MANPNNSNHLAEYDDTMVTMIVERLSPYAVSLRTNSKTVGYPAAPI